MGRHVIVIFELHGELVVPPVCIVVVSNGWSQRPEDYDCMLTYEVQTYFTDVACDDCDFAITVVGDLSPDSYGERTCSWAPVGEFDLAVFYDGRYSDVYYYYGYYGYYGWYPIYGGVVSDGRIELDYASIDYEYEYYGATYYETYVIQGSMSLPTEE